MGYVKQHNATPVPKQALQYVKCKEIKKKQSPMGCKSHKHILFTVEKKAITWLTGENV